MPPLPDPPSAKLEAVAGELRQYIEALALDDAFSGVALAAHKGRPFLEEARGFASLAFQAPNRVDTRFNLASLNKMFTAVAIGQLLEQGKLSLDKPILEYLPSYPNRPAGAKISLHHLLTHTSGLGDYFNSRFAQAAKDRFSGVLDYFPLFVDDPLAFEPGARFQYSDAGYVVLGAVTESVSGEDYFEYVQRHIFEPSGMCDSSSEAMDEDTRNRAIGYTLRHPRGQLNQRRSNLFLHVYRGGPAGGGFSTAHDLLRFAQALANGKLLKPSTKELFLSGKVPMDKNGSARYAYGFVENCESGQRTISHAGAFAGINTLFEMHPDSGYTLIVLSNYDPPSAFQVGDRARRLLLPS
jgi:CubicO group peptidase (beta-lactamase class C family)